MWSLLCSGMMMVLVVASEMTCFFDGREFDNYGRKDHQYQKQKVVLIFFDSNEAAMLPLNIYYR